MNGKMRFLNLKSLKKRTWRCHVFYLNYGEVRKRRFSSKRFFVSPMKLLLFFHSRQIVIHLFLARKALFHFFYSQLPQSFDQNTKQDTTPCSRVSGENKENNSLQSHISLKNVFGACSNQAQQKSNSRTAIFDVERKAKQKVILICLTPRDYQLQFIVSCLRPIKLSTLFSHELLAFISVSRHFWSHHPNKAFLFLKGLSAKKLNLVIGILFPLRKKYISGLLE